MNTGDRRRKGPGPRGRLGFALIWTALVAGGCSGRGSGPEVEVTVPSGASFRTVVDTLQTRGLVTKPTFFRAYARVRGLDRAVRSGRYAFRQGDGWATLLEDLVTGRVQTVMVTIPEGFTLRQMAERIAPITGRDAEELREQLGDSVWGARFQVPGPGLEGYLFPDSYRFAEGSSLDAIVTAMRDRYQAYWNVERRAQLEASTLSERQLVTLASIVQAEARQVDEMPRIASVYRNRIDRNWLLQADPTVLYALGGPRERLLYAAIDSVANHPYNTYTQPGLPPGPIGAPGSAALDAALGPAAEPFLYFVARPDGRHVFTRTLAEHNRAKVSARREWDALARDRTAEREGDPSLER